MNVDKTILKARFLTTRWCISLAALVVLVVVAGPPVLAQEGPLEEGRGFVDIEGNPHEEDIRFIVNRGGDRRMRSRGAPILP